ncbi:hypothetical protein QJQ45_020823 [Haematococcus lacustris]|nr:hypothetical protein QJQ45_020823 [Haematococcus lacustris]
MSGESDQIPPFVYAVALTLLQRSRSRCNACAKVVPDCNCKYRRASAGYPPPGYPPPAGAMELRHLTQPPTQHPIQRPTPPLTPLPATQPLITIHHPGMATPLAMCMAELHPITRPTPLMEAITTMVSVQPAVLLLLLPQAQAQTQGRSLHAAPHGVLPASPSLPPSQEMSEHGKPSGQEVPVQ